MIKESTEQFRLYYKYDDGRMSEPEPFVRPDLVKQSRTFVRNYFRDMLKRFNHGIRPGESKRHFVKVTNKVKVTTKAKKVSERWQNV